MATAATLKSIDSLTAVDARMEALDRLEKLADEAAAEVARHRSNLLLKRGIKASITTADADTCRASVMSSPSATSIARPAMAHPLG